MGCIVEPLPIDKICDYTASGIRRVFISKFFETISPSSVTIVNGEVISLNSSVSWLEIPIDNFTGQYQEDWDKTINKYIVNLKFSLVGMRDDWRLPIDRLNRGKWSFLIQDNNKRWWLTGLSSMKINSSVSQSGLKKSPGNGYFLEFIGKQSLPAYTVSDQYIDNLPECTDSFTELALSSIYLWTDFWFCIVGDHPDFIP